MKYLAILLVAGVLVCSVTARSVCDAEKGEKFTTCGTDCPATCDNYNDLRLCTLRCVIGCECVRGTVRRVSDGYCVKPEDC